MYIAIEACFVILYVIRSLVWPKVWNFIAVKLRVELEFAHKLKTQVLFCRFNQQLYYAIRMGKQCAGTGNE